MELIAFEPHVIAVQRHFRGYLCRHGTHKYSHLGTRSDLNGWQVAIARMSRGCIGRRRARRAAHARDAADDVRAATRVQSTYRGHRGRNRAREQLRYMLRDTMAAVCGDYVFRIFELRDLNDVDQREAQAAVHLLHPTRDTRPRVVTQAELRHAVVAMLRLHGKRIRRAEQRRGDVVTCGT
eukprot:g4755.t1